MLQVNQMFTDHMVLQRECTNLIFGTDDPGEKITVFFRSDVYTAKADQSGKWEILLKACECGGPFRMLIQGSSRIELTDILIGDVYLLAGQSNMELRMMDILDENIPAGWDEEDEQIRYFRAEPRYSFGKAAESVQSAGWQRAVREYIKLFSAAGLYFAREIRAHHDVPIGLVNIAVGGSSVEAWMPAGALRPFGSYMESVQPFSAEGMLERTIEEQTCRKTMWEEELVQEDKPSDGEWKDYCVPGMAADYYPGGYTGSLWLEKTFQLEALPEEDALLNLGLIIDRDYVWVNDAYIGMSEHRYCMRQYNVPKQVLRKGDNTLRIKIIIENQNGGIVPEKDCHISVGKKRIPLEGAWRYREGIRRQQPAPEVLFAPLLPMGLFYGVLLPLRSLRFQAVLWYQGESNAGQKEDYSALFRAMKESWEAVFERRLRFCCVQLAGYQDPIHGKRDTGWGMIREYQRRCTSGSLSAHGAKQDGEAFCGLVTAIDVGERYDLHPHNKWEVGRRLALWGRRFLYGEDIEYRGPVCTGYEREQGKLLLSFFHDDMRESSLSGFEVSYDGVCFRSVQAYHRNGTVILDLQGSKAEDVRAVRYAWYDYPGNIDFYNSAGIPAESFLLEIMNKQIRNPILKGMHPDPSICRVGEKYYMVNSTFAYAPGVPIFESDDLLTWKQIGNVLEREEQLDLIGLEVSLGIFAPTLRFHNGTFYMITTNVGKCGTFYVTADKPEGPWSAPVVLEQAEGIDPSLYFEGDRCFYVGQRGKADPPYEGACEIWIQELDLKQGRLIGEARAVWDGAARNAMWAEGPHLYQKDGWYYLMIAEGGTYHEHSVSVARSREIYGPYESCKNNPVFTHRQLGKEYPIQNTGHADLVETADGSWYAVMLATRMLRGKCALGRETFLVPVIWEDGWPVFYAGEGRVPVTDSIFGGKREEIIAWEEALDLSCVMLRKRLPAEMRSTKEGRLHLRCGKDALSGTGNPSYIGVRVEEYDFSIETVMDFEPENGEEAGLAYFYNAENFLTLSVGKENGRLTQTVKITKKGKETVLYNALCEQEEYTLRMEGHDGRMTCRIGNRLCGEQISLEALTTEEAGGFVGCMMGVFAVTAREQSGTRAVFGGMKISYA